MITLNVGNLFDYNFLHKAQELNDTYAGTGIKVTSMYGSIAGLTPTARAVDRLPSRDWPFLEKYIKEAQDSDIAVRYTINMSCIGPLQDFDKEWSRTIRPTCERLHDLGVQEWTVASPLVCELLHLEFPKDFIEVSTIAEVATPEEWQRWWVLGARGVCLSTSVNRDFHVLTAIRDAAEDDLLSILANEACLYKCPWRRECYNLSSHNSLRSKALFRRYPFSRCQGARYADPEEWVRARIVLPQWMGRYRELTGIYNFKVAFRTHPYEVAVPILEAYMSQYWGGNLIELWPTVAPFAGLEEPKEVISCRKLDEDRFLGYFIGHGSECRYRTCGIDCTHCKEAYDSASVRENPSGRE